jgi:hypothetical protein
LCAAGLPDYQQVIFWKLERKEQEAVSKIFIPQSAFRNPKW